MLLYCWWECKLKQPLWKIVQRFLKQLEMKPPYDPTIPLLGIYPEETKIEKDRCIPMLTAALFTIARTWKQTRCPSTNEWIKKQWYNGILLNHKKNAFESVLMRWMNLEAIMLSELSQKEQYNILTHIYRIWKNGTEEFTYRAAMEKQTQRIDLWTWGEGRRG